jgi:hypothetical protein
MSFLKAALMAPLESEMRMKISDTCRIDLYYQLELLHEVSQMKNLNVQIFSLDHRAKGI